MKLATKSLVILLIFLGGLVCLFFWQGQKTPYAQLKQAKKYLAQDDYRLAMMTINKVISRLPNEYAAYVVRGDVHERQGLYSMALDDYARALAVDKDGREALMRRGLIFQRLGRYDRARTEFERVINSNPEDAEGYLQHGKTYLKQDNYKAALNDFSRALTLQPRHPQIHQEMGLLYEKQQDFVMAESQYQLAISQYPNDIEARISLGSMYARQNRMEDGIQAFHTAIELDPRRGDVYYKRSFLHFAAGRYQEALDDIVRAQYLGQKVDAGYIERLRVHQSQDRAKNGVKK